MLTAICKYIFIALAIILTSMIVYGKLFVFKKKHPAFVSDYCGTMAGLLLVYILFSLILAWMFPGTSQKLAMLGFAIAPFLIGLLATYHTEKYFTVLQVFVYLISIFFVI